MFYRVCCWYSINISFEWASHGCIGLAVCFLCDWSSHADVVCFLVVSCVWLSRTAPTDIGRWTEVPGTCYWRLCCFPQGIWKILRGNMTIILLIKLSVDKQLKHAFPNKACNWLPCRVPEFRTSLEHICLGK